MKCVSKYILPFLIIPLLFSCKGTANNSEDENAEDSELNVVSETNLDSSDAMNTTINGKIFSIPSPIQMVTLIKTQDAVFNENILTNPNGVEKFTTTYQRAINMGIYGADLGYATVYENNSKAVTYLKSVDKLAEELGISGAFDQNLVERFIDNGNNQDSMLIIMSEGYRKGDEFLKDNKQHDVASLILTGGWIESMFFAATIFEKSKDQEIANRIGEQKTALKTIVDLLTEFNVNNDYTDLIGQLNGLLADFEKIEFNYEFVASVHDAKNFQTNIKSKSSVKMNDAVLNNIVKKIKSIRNGLIG